MHTVNVPEPSEADGDLEVVTARYEAALARQNDIIDCGVRWYARVRQIYATKPGAVVKGRIVDCERRLAPQPQPLGKRKGRST